MSRHPIKLLFLLFKNSEEAPPASILLALDALFIDEVGTLSNKQLAVLDIMF